MNPTCDFIFSLEFTWQWKPICQLWWDMGFPSYNLQVYLLNFSKELNESG